MTWRHSTIGSAIATARVTAPTRLARRRCRSPLPTHALYHLTQGLRHCFCVVLGQLREEGQRDRASGDVLADGELAFAVPVRLAVVGHQVNGGQVGLGLHAALAQGEDRLVAVDAV